MVVNYLFELLIIIDYIRGRINYAIVEIISCMIVVVVVAVVVWVVVVVLGGVSAVLKGFGELQELEPLSRVSAVLSF